MFDGGILWTESVRSQTQRTYFEYEDNEKKYDLSSSRHHTWPCMNKTPNVPTQHFSVEAEND